MATVNTAAPAQAASAPVTAAAHTQSGTAPPAHSPALTLQPQTGSAQNQQQYQQSQLQQPQPAAPASSQPALSLAPQPLSLQPQPFSLQPQPLGLQPQPLSLQPQPLSLQPQPLSLQPQPLSLAPQPISFQPQPISFQPQPVSFQPQSVQGSALAPAPASAAPAPAASGSVAPAPAAGGIPPLPEVDANLPVVNDDAALEQCQDWSFFIELVNDMFAVIEEALGKMDQCIATNDHAQFGKEAHALKGAALNLHMPAISDVTKKAEIIGKQLALTPDLPDWLAARQIMVDHLKVEYARLRDVLPLYQERADAGEADDGEGDEDGPTFH